MLFCKDGADAASAKMKSSKKAIEQQLNRWETKHRRLEALFQDNKTAACVDWITMDHAN